MFNIKYYLSLFKFKDFILLSKRVDRTDNSIISDIDILLKIEDLKNLYNILKKENNICIIQILHHDIYAKNIFLLDREKKELLNLDFYGELSRRGVVFFSEEEIFKTKKLHNGIPVLNSAKEFIFYFIKKLDKNDLNKENFAYLRKLYFEEKEESQNYLKRFLPKNSKFIIEAIEKNNLDNINKHRNIILKEFDKNKKFSLIRKIKNIIRIFNRLRKPTGFSIAFLGPDGSGKSTIINSLNIYELPFRRKDYFHLKPIKIKNNSNRVINEPHKYEPYNKLKSYLKLAYFLIQYNIGWLKNIYPLKIKSSLVIFDRYYDDLLVDYKRYRYGGSLKLAKLLRKFITKPDLYFVLVTDPEIIYQRKQEVDFEELKRQVEEYKKLCDGKRYICIDVSKSIEEVKEKIILKIMEKMSERY